MKYQWNFVYGFREKDFHGFWLVKVLFSYSKRGKSPLKIGRKGRD